MGIMDKMKQAKDMYGNMKKMQQEVDKIVVEASSRNKLITVSAKGNHQILSIKIDDQLTQGTTWHAAGLVGQLGASSTITRLRKYSLNLYKELEKKTGLSTGLKQNGAITVASYT